MNTRPKWSNPFRSVLAYSTYLTASKDCVGKIQTSARVNGGVAKPRATFALQFKLCNAVAKTRDQTMDC